MATKIAAATSIPHSIAVSSVGYGLSGSARLQGWSPVAKIEASEFTGGHNYLLLFFGTVGDFFYENPSQRWLSAWLAWRVAGGTYLDLDYCHRQPVGLSIWDRLWDYQKKQRLGGQRGLAVTMAIEYTQPGTAVDVELVGRICTAGPTDPARGEFLVDNPTILAIDLTQAASELEMEEHTVSRYAASPTAGISIPWRPAVPLLGSSFGGTTLTGDWLVGHAHCLCPGNTTETTQAYLMQGGSATTTFVRPCGISQPSNPRDVNHCKLWTGQQGIREELGTGQTWQTYYHHVANSGSIPSLFLAERAWAIRLHPDQRAFYNPATKGVSSLFFAGEQFSPVPIELERTLSFPDETLILGHAGDGQTAYAHWQRIEINGAEVTGPFVYSHPMPGTFTNGTSTRSYLGVLERGTQRLKLRGLRHYLDAATSARQNGYDAQLYGFGLMIDFIPPLQPDESKGPVAQVTPNRETLVASSSLPALPFEPSYSLSAGFANPRRELVIPARGYRITSPKFLGMRRTFRLQWTGLNQTNRDTLATWLEALPQDAGGGAFRWQPPDELEELPLIPDPFTWRESRTADGHFLVELDATELVFLTP